MSGFHKENCPEPVAKIIAGRVSGLFFLGKNGSKTEVGSWNFLSESMTVNKTNNPVWRANFFWSWWDEPMLFNNFFCFVSIIGFEFSDNVSKVVANKS